MLQVSELYQVGIVVHDLEKSMERYQRILGIGPWDIMDVDPSTVNDLTYRGRKVQHKFRCAMAMVGSMQLELIQPLEGESIQSDFLKEHGEGLHHLGHIRVDNLEEAVQKLEREGFACLQSGRFSGGAFAYMDTVKELGTIIELLEMPEGQPAPFRR